jgi:hypothetical protein
MEGHLDGHQSEAVPGQTVREQSCKTQAHHQLLRAIAFDRAARPTINSRLGEV